MKSIYSTNLYKLKGTDALMLYRSSVDSKEKELLPPFLLDIPLLAKLLTDFISTFNELRYVALRGSALKICASINKHLASIAQSIVNAETLVSQIVVPKARSENLVSNKVNVISASDF